MKAVSKFGLLLAVGLVTCPAFAVSAQAVTISPDDTDIVGTADNPTLNYGNQTIQCDTGTAAGTTGIDSDVVDVDIEFQEPCSFQPAGLNAVVTCNDGAFVRLRALNGTTNTGEVDALLPGFQCRVVVTGICTLTVGPQELPISGGQNAANLVNEGGPGEAIEVDVDVFVTNNNSLCGTVPSGTGHFHAVYVLDTAVTIDP